MKKSLWTITALLPLAVSCGQHPDLPGYAGRDLTGLAEITRDRNTKEATLTVGVSGPWRLYGGPAADSIDFSEPVLAGKGSCSHAIDTPLPQRHACFLFAAGDDRALLAERLLPMAGGYNMRDLGGYRSEDGRYVRWGRIIRSDDLHGLTDADLAYLASLPVATVVDFRSAEEAQAMPDRLPGQGTAYLRLPITPGNLDDIGSYISMTPEEVEAKMEWMYVYFATSDEGKARYREFFRLLQQPEAGAVLFHCSAGKDRTGMAAALVLYALGIPEATVMEDYLASDGYLAGKYDRYKERFPQLAGLFEVRPEYLSAGIERIKADYGSVERYLRDELDVDIEAFRDAYLY